MTENGYAGMLDPMREQIIAQRARRMGFRGADLDDVLQEMALEAHDFKYDPSRTAMSEKSALSVWIDNRLKNYIRSSKRRRNREERKAVENARHTTDYASHENMAQDAEFNLFAASLRPFDRKVFEWLRQAKDTTFIAHKLKRRWHTVDAATRRIAESLARKGLIPPGYSDNP